ncbi:MAG: class II aldolase/adducin family protein, partial [Planctomycetota bacterium]
MTTAATRTHVHDLWDDTLAASEDALGRLVHRSNALGSDQRITNTGGGNTSSKATEIDPLTGEPVEVLWVKGSGGDLRTSGRGNFSSLYMDKLNGLKRVYAEAADAGLKSPAEDGMVAMYKHCTFNLNPRASSIDTPLHAFVPARHVDHMHPNAVIALAASKDGERVMREIYGDELFWLPWMRPGFELGLELERGCRENPNARGAIMGQHGLINWADDDRECYELTLDLIERSAKYIEDRDKAAHTFGGQKHAALAPADRRDTLLAVLPHLRGRVSVQRRMIATVQDDPATLRFVCSNDAGRLAELGTSCPDHFLRTKIKPLLVDWDPASRDIEALLRAIDTGI